MTIEYKDSKRIVSLSSDVSNTPSTEEVNFGSGYTYNSSYFSATGSNGYTFTENASNIDQVMWKDLTTSVVGTKYVMRFPFTLTSFTSHTTSGNNHKQEIGLGASYGTGEDPTHDGFFCRYVQQQGVNEVRFFVLARDGSTKNLSQAYSIGYSSISTPTTWYIELIKNEDVYTLNVYSDSAYSDLLGTATVTQTGITGLRYFNHNIFTQSSNGVSIGSSAGYDIYNGVSSLTNKPTDVQDNSIMVEKDTAKRYWFSKATVVDDDLTTDKGWVSNTSAWTYNASGDYLDFATITRSTTAQQIYLDVHDSDYLGSGNNLSDTAWTARFKIRTGTQSSSTGNVLFYFGFSNNLGDSGTTQQTVTMKMNFNGQANENNMTLSVSRVNFENTSPPARVNSDVYANTNLPYSTDLYMEMTRNGDVFTLKAYSDEYVTQASSTSVASVTVTGISGLQYIKAFNDSEQPQSYTSGGARLYDMEITNGSDTWTREPFPITRGVIAGGQISGGVTNIMDYITIATTGNAIDFGDLSANKYSPASAYSTTRGLIAGGYTGSGYLNVIDYITILTAGNASDFGDLSQSTYSNAGVSNNTRGVFSNNGTGRGNTLEYVTIDTLGNTTDFGDLTRSTTSMAGNINSETRGVFSGGNDSGDTTSEVIDYITIDTTGNATDFGNLTQGRYGGAGLSSETRGVCMGGVSGGAVNTIDYITIETPSNATDFGDLTSTSSPVTGGLTNNTRGVTSGVGGITTTMDYITIATTGNASDFGDVTVAKNSSAGVSG